MSKRYGHILPQIIDRRNMDDAFDEVVGGLESKERREHYEAQREGIISRLTAKIGSGTFRITHYEQFWVQDGPKRRLIQSPSVKDRIGCNAVMRVVEKYIYPTIIKTSAASIKGRGMHRLYRKMRTDVRHDREGTKYFYMCDIRKFYESVDQDLTFEILKGYIKDPVVLPMLESFIRLMPKGLSIGLRSSQCFGNMLLSKMGHRLKEKEGVRYLYIYCDDIRVYGATKKWLWHIRDIIHEEIESLGLEIKPSEAVKPTTEGNDFLGYIDYGDHSRLRKRTKQKAARKLARIKSRKRRQKIIGSFKGMAKWGDCKHLYRTLTGKDMEEFKDFGLQYVADDGKKRFAGETIKLHQLTNMHISITDFEENVDTANGKRTLVSFKYDNGTPAKYFTADKQQLYFLKRLSEMHKIPFGTVIKSESYGNGKVRYIFT